MIFSEKKLSVENELFQMIIDKISQHFHIATIMMISGDMFHLIIVLQGNLLIRKMRVFKIAEDNHYRNLRYFINFRDNG